MCSFHVAEGPSHTYIFHMTGSFILGTKVYYRSIRHFETIHLASLPVGCHHNYDGLDKSTTFHFL